VFWRFICVSLPFSPRRPSQFDSFYFPINRWRMRTLHLPRIFGIVSSKNLVSGSKIPFSAMWSPAFVPKPHDWPEQCEVVGTFTNDQAKDFDTKPFAELITWLGAGSKPVFLGFGSMVIKDPGAVEGIIKSAARKANVRVVVQSGWSQLNVEEEGNDLCRNVGPCPHDWLLPQCCAVVHHGGAGEQFLEKLAFMRPTGRLAHSFYFYFFKWNRHNGSRTTIRFADARLSVFRRSIYVGFLRRDGRSWSESMPN